MICMMLGLWVVMTVNPEEIWRSANTRYANGDYAGASEMYESLVARGVKSDALFYNLGNAYFKDGELGRALLFFYRAERINPLDEDIRHNLKLARAQRKDPLMDEERDDVVSHVRRLLLAVPYGWVFSLAAVLILVATLLWTQLVLQMRVVRARAYTASACLLVSGLLVFIAFAHHALRYDSHEAVVVSPAVEVRAGPSNQEPTVFQIHEGLPCIMMEFAEDWVRIRLANGYNGWVPTRSLEPVLLPGYAG